MEFDRPSPKDLKPQLTNIEGKLANFLNILKINDLSNITITSFQTSTLIYLNSRTECVQYDVNFNIPINFNVDLKISYPRRATINEHTEIEKLRINVNNEAVKQEIIICTNYLQRQKNVNLALSILKRCSTVITERRLILDMLVLHSEGFVKYTNIEDGGIHLLCVNPNTNFKYFESEWKIQFDCLNNLVLDYIDFAISIKDPEFYSAAMPIVNLLTEPNLLYNMKVDLWWKIIYAVSESVTRDLLQCIKPSHTSEEHDARRFSTVRSVRENDLFKNEVESDDEDCIIIEDD